MGKKTKTVTPDEKLSKYNLFIRKNIMNMEGDTVKEKMAACAELWQEKKGKKEDGNIEIVHKIKKGKGEIVKIKETIQEEPEPSPPTLKRSKHHRKDED